MWRTCVTLALLICVQVCAHGPLYPRVMGGANAQKKAWPWIVSLHDPTCHFCGGSLISSQWVLSAAHCFIRPNYLVNATSLRGYLGKLTQREKNEDEKVIYVDRIYTHNNYNATTEDNDIALLHLSDKVKFNDHISPLCLLAQGSDFPTGKKSWIIGWGKTALGVNLPYPGILQEAEVLVADHSRCQNNLMQLINQRRTQGIRITSRVTNNMICAGVPGGGVDAYCVQLDDCYSLLHIDNGDSGGPMMSQHCSKWVQSGIISWGIDCGLQHIPGVYTRVSQYQQWITDTIRNHPSEDLPQFVNLTLPCPSAGSGGSKWKFCCCF